MGGETGYKFMGWVGLDKTSVQGKLVRQECVPKPWEETDIDIKVSHCGICGTDLHTLRSGWGEANYPVCPGHEIIGTIVRLGSAVKKSLFMGARVGIGCQVFGCGKCKECVSGFDNYCGLAVNAYNDKYADGSKTYGGYSDYVRAPGAYAFLIPDAIASEDAAVMMCAGVTTYNPMVMNGAGPGKTVGVVGIGGLGHFALLWAKALNCDRVVAISRTNAKREDALKMGADEFVATAEDNTWQERLGGSIDLIICTVDSNDMPLESYLWLLAIHGTFIQVGAPDDKLPSISVMPLLLRGSKFGGSTIGSSSQIEAMLELAAKKNVKPWVENRPMSDVNAVIVDMDKGKAKYRYVLENSS